MFWKTVKPFLSYREGEELVTDDVKVGNVRNKHFVNSLPCLAEKGGLVCIFAIFMIGEMSKASPKNNYY